jgi:hypothetical protein
MNNEKLKINLNYWSNCPLIVDENILNCNKVLQIIPNDILLKKMETVITSHQYKLFYKINDENINKLKKFINKNNINILEPEYLFLYTKDFLEYYIKNSLVLSFYSKTKNNELKMIGLIIGKKSLLFINNQEFNTIETNFLILDPKVRNNNLAPLMISILTKESILNYSTSLSHYTISNEIKAPYFSLKYYYHRIINIKKLLESNFLSKDINIEEYKKKYNNFINYLDNQQIIYLKNITDELIDYIYHNINLFSKQNYTIFDYKTKEQIKDILNSKSFHNFIFIEPNSNNEYFIKNYICLNELKIINTTNKNYYKNGYIYMGFYDDDINQIIEKLSEYIYLNKILDVITWTDFFKMNQYLNIINGSSYLKYYLFNTQIFKIENQNNGLVTL